MGYLRKLERSLVPAVERALGVFSVVVIVGPRQVGKTTLVQDERLGAGRLYLTLDELDLLAEARSNPDRLLGRGARVTVDEVQKAPELLLSIKRAVDRERGPGRFLVTGSADIRGMRQVADHLPGRAVYLHLEPMSAAELRSEPAHDAFGTLLSGAKASDVRDAFGSIPKRNVDLAHLVVRGGLPEPALLRDADARELWFSGYLRAWLERGVPELSVITELPNLRRHMGAFAARTGGILNAADVARDAGLPSSTAHRYQGLLSLGFLLDLLPAWSRNIGIRVIKAPKVYWRDVGLAAHLVGMHGRAEGLRDHPARGPLLENLVLMNLRAWASARARSHDFFYWRTAGGREIDLIVEMDDRVIPIEVKASGRVRSDDLRHLEYFLDLNRRHSPYGVILHTGTTVETPAPNVVAIPLASVL